MDLPAPIGQAQVGLDGRPIVGLVRSPGLDPYSMLHTHFDTLPPENQPSVQVIVRAAGNNSMVTTSNTSGTLLGQKLDRIVSVVWRVDSYAVIVAEALQDERFDVIYRLPMPHERVRAAGLMPVMRNLIALGLNVSILKETRTMDGYELHKGEGGVTLREGVSQHSGSSISSNGETFTITSANMPHVALVRSLSQYAGVPIDDKTGLSGSHFVEHVLPMDPEELAAVLEEMTGLALVPKLMEVDVLVVRRH